MKQLYLLYLLCIACLIGGCANRSADTNNVITESDGGTALCAIPIPFEKIR